jgi:DNA-binding NtrC family response regulator
MADPSLMVGGGVTVLIVEDNMPLRRAGARQLAELGYRVVEAEHAEAAMAILAGDDPVDVLFSDVVMPGTMDGLDLAREATRSRPALKVLLTSGFPGVGGAVPRTVNSPFPLLTKPYRHDELARAIRGLWNLVDDRPPAAGTRASDGSNRSIRAGGPIATTERV